MLIFGRYIISGYVSNLLTPHICMFGYVCHLPNAVIIYMYILSRWCPPRCVSKAKGWGWHCQNVQCTKKCQNKTNMCRYRRYYTFNMLDQVTDFKKKYREKSSFQTFLQCQGQGNINNKFSRANIHTSPQLLNDVDNQGHVLLTNCRDPSCP